MFRKRVAQTSLEYLLIIAIGLAVTGIVWQRIRKTSQRTAENVDAVVSYMNTKVTSLVATSP